MSFKKDSLYLTANSLQQNLFAVLVSVFLARYLSPAGFGTFSFFFSILTIYTLIGTGGLRQYLPAISKRSMVGGHPPPSSMLTWALILVGLVTGVHLVLYAGGVYERFNTGQEGIYLLLAGFILTRGLILSVRGIFIGYGRMRLFLYTSVAQEATKVAALPLLLMAGMLQVRSVILVWTLLSTAFAVLMAILYITWLRQFPDRASWKPVWSPALAESLTFLFPAASLMLIPRLIVFAIGSSFTPELTAEITVALTFISIFGIFLIPYQTAFLSNVQSYRDPASLREFVIKSAGRQLMLTVLLAIVTFGTGWFGTVPVFGGEYKHATTFLLPLTVAFAVESPKTVLDAFWVSRLPGRLLIVLEIIKLTGILTVFLLPLELSVTARIYWLGALFALINVIKTVAVKSRLDTQDV